MVTFMFSIVFWIFPSFFQFFFIFVESKNHEERTAPLLILNKYNVPFTCPVCFGSLYLLPCTDWLAQDPRQTQRSKQPGIKEEAEHSRAYIFSLLPWPKSKNCQSNSHRFFLFKKAPIMEIFHPYCGSLVYWAIEIAFLAICLFMANKDCHKINQTAFKTFLWLGRFRKPLQIGVFHGIFFVHSFFLLIRYFWVLSILQTVR